LIGDGLDGRGQANAGDIALMPDSRCDSPERAPDHDSHCRATH
jgi:hypothetical protein